MAEIVLWLVMTSGQGYIEPMTLAPSALHCGLPGPIVGVQVDRLEDPTIARWTDPVDPNLHCDVDVAARVAAMPMGEFHFAVTGVRKLGDTGTYLFPDPHTSRMWMRSGHAPLPPASTPLPTETTALIASLQLQVFELQAKLTALTTQQAAIRQQLLQILTLLPQ